MSKLTKVILINWMYFKKATLPIEGNTAIVGVNGTGKSTIIDAIQMLLLGQKQSKFNSGTSAEKRTLESYVRGHIDSDNKEFLRQGDVITYLALEVNVDGEKHIFGISLEYKSNQNKLTEPKYFYIKNCDLKEQLFVTDKNYPKPYDDFNKQAKKEYEFVPFQTLMTYQNKIKEIFGLKSENAYFKILSRAVGLKNITECDKFMNEFVLDESSIDVSEIKNNILEMTKVSKTIEREEDKLRTLDEIVTKGNQIVLDSEKLTDLELKSIVGVRLINEYQVKKLQNENQTLLALMEEEKNKQQGLKNLNNELYSSKNEYIKALEEISPDLPNKQAELDRINLQYDETHLTYNTFNTKCNTELSNLAQLKYYKNSVFDAFLEYIKNGEFTSASAKQKFIEFRDEARLVEKKYQSKADKMTHDLTEVRNELENLKIQIHSLENNQYPFDPRYEEFKQYIKDGLYDKYHKDIEVKFLCEYLDITDDSWRNAIEGYLGAQRFHLIVPNMYYKDALKLYYANKKLSGVRLVNGLKLPNFDVEEGTLGSYVVASNNIALNYARYLLNRVHCVNDILELDKFDISITKDCMCYQNYGSWRIPASIYRKSYIGLKGLKKQLAIVKEDYSRLNADAFQLVNEYNKNIGYVNVIQQEEKFATSILEDSSYLSSIDKDNELFQRINKLTEEINFYQSNPQHMEIMFKIGEIEKNIESNERLIVKCDEQIVDYSSSIKLNDKTILEKTEEIEIISAKLSSYTEFMIDKVTNELSEVKLSMVYVDKLKQDFKIVEKKIIKDKSDLENLMRNARDKFSINCEPEFESLDKFKDEKSKINSSVFKYKTKFVEMQKSHRKLFFSEFLSKLNKSIEQAKETINNLNASLDTFHFGKDHYSIKVGITENLDLRTIYDYAKKFNSEDSNRGIFVDMEVEDRERQKVEELVNQYMFSEDINTQAIVIDYRKYLYFDVEVHTPDGTKSLNKVIRSQSGGEVQVPFYILSGVAFKQTLDYKRNKDSLGIVLYDEAFDKMDSQRIQSMLQFYRDKLKLQVILAAPGKLDSLVDNIETILAVVRDGEKATVSDISHEI